MKTYKYQYNSYNNFVRSLVYHRETISLFHVPIQFRTDPMNTTGVPIKYSSAPVLFEMKKFLDQWEDSMRPLTMVYYAKIHVEYDTNYIFRVSLDVKDLNIHDSG